jgi:hypothetical protein
MNEVVTPQRLAQEILKKLADPDYELPKVANVQREPSTYEEDRLFSQWYAGGPGGPSGSEW